MCCRYSLYGVMVAMHSLSFWKSVHQLGTVPTAVSKGAQQAGVFIFSHIIYCHYDKAECIDNNYGTSVWHHMQKRFVFCSVYLNRVLHASSVLETLSPEPFSACPLSHCCICSSASLTLIITRTYYDETSRYILVLILRFSLAAAFCFRLFLGTPTSHSKVDSFKTNLFWLVPFQSHLNLTFPRRQTSQQIVLVSNHTSLSASSRCSDWHLGLFFSSAYHVCAQCRICAVHYWSCNLFA